MNFNSVKRDQKAWKDIYGSGQGISSIQIVSSRTSAAMKSNLMLERKLRKIEELLKLQLKAKPKFRILIFEVLKFKTIPKNYSHYNGIHTELNIHIRELNYQVFIQINIIVDS